MSNGATVREININLAKFITNEDEEKRNLVLFNEELHEIFQDELIVNEFNDCYDLGMNLKKSKDFEAKEGGENTPPFTLV